MLSRLLKAKSTVVLLLKLNFIMKVHVQSMVFLLI